MANIWRDPIFDRTYADVSFAISKIAEWKKNHTHSADIKLEQDALIVQDASAAYVNDDAFVLENDGAVYIEDDVLVAELGTVYDLKGCLNLSDITRIEDNITYLSSRLIQYHYPVDVRTREWTKDSLPKLQDMERIIRNIRSILGEYVEPDDVPTLPITMLSYQDINAIERNLYLIKEVFDAMVNSFIKSGTYKSGASMHLPIRR